MSSGWVGLHIEVKGESSTISKNWLGHPSKVNKAPDVKTSASPAQYRNSAQVTQKRI